MYGEPAMESTRRREKRLENMKIASEKTNEKKIELILMKHQTAIQATSAEN
jgi:hypothetical protein